MSLIQKLSWLWRAKKKQPLPVRQQRAQNAGSGIRPGAKTAQRASVAVDEDDGGAPATQLMSSRAMVDILVDEILQKAGIGRHDKSMRLYSLAAPSEPDDGRFILLVKFKVAKSGLWEYLPALGAYLCNEIRQRVGVNVAHVYWSVASNVLPVTKIPGEWVEGNGGRRI